MNDNIFIDPETGDKYRGSGMWLSTAGRHGNCWNDVGRLVQESNPQRSGLVLHKLGSLNRFRAYDTQHPYHTHFCELTYVYTPT